MAGTINCNQLIPDPGQDLYINTGQYGANLVVGNATTQILVVTPDGGLKVPVGTTAGRPTNPQVGFIRFNSDTNVLENYTANGWFKVSVQQPTISSISGSIYNGNTSTIVITGTGFGAASANVNFSGANNATVTGLTPTNGGQSLSVTVPSAIYTIITGSTVGVSVTNSDGATGGAYTMTVIGLPTGGTLTTSGNTRTHTFTSSGSLVVPTGFSKTASYLIIAGGGGGGFDVGGGGGAGGLISGSASISAGTYSVTVGGGGGGAGTNTTLNPGSNSSFNSYTASGGGAGGNWTPNTVPGYSAYVNGASGGSGGGGGGYINNTSGGSGTPGQGYGGGSCSSSGPQQTGGGGGGAGSVGSNSITSLTGYVDGGSGVASNISGSPTTYSAGGKGGGDSWPGPSPGGTNTGNGGDGSGGPAAGSGGSGIVIVSYTI